MTDLKEGISVEILKVALEIRECKLKERNKMKLNSQSPSKVMIKNTEIFRDNFFKGIEKEEEREKAIRALNKIKCNICGYEFIALESTHYISRNNTTLGLTNAIRKDEPQLYDSFDCPICGCQITVQERKRKLIINTSSEEGDDTNEESEE